MSSLQKLDDWGFPYLVIPHGNTWGFYTPPRSSWDKQLAEHEDPDRDEFLVEVFSGHGNCEEYRDWRAVELDENGKADLSGACRRTTCRAAGVRARSFESVAPLPVKVPRSVTDARGRRVRTTSRPGPRGT